VKGRKRHLVVDTIGLPLAIEVLPADIQDRDGAKTVLERMVGAFPRLEKMWADGGYAGKLIAWVREHTGWELEIVKRSDDMTGFVVLPRRWVVERTFAWWGRYRRLSKDYEQCIDSSQATLQIASIHIMLKRLKPGA